MSDALFFIMSAMVVSGAKSIYSSEERFSQTIETIESIDKYCPNSKKVLIDASAIEPEKRFFDGIKSREVDIFYTGNDVNVNKFSTYGLKSLGEALSFLIVLNYFKQQYDDKNLYKRIYKISGRYKLNENFKIGTDHEKKYVFTIPTKTWMNEDRIKETGVDHVYQSRLFHFDYSLIDQFIVELNQVISDCIKFNIDIEHAYYKNFKKYNPIELEKIGVCGNQAPTGLYIDE